MINRIVKKITGKDIVFVHNHRNSAPIIEDNRDKYIFFDPGILWRLMGIVGRRRKLRYRLMYMLLSIVRPAWIIDINWLDKLQSLFLVWGNNHDKQFVVVQHGIYYGGIMRDIPEKYIKCNVMLVWSDYFKKMFLENNPNKNFRCISFGNPIYNQHNRSTFEYSENVENKVLLAPSLIKGHRLKRQYELINKLREFGFDITIKEHYKQKLDSEPIEVEGCKKTDGDDFHLYRLLKSQMYDIVITDVSSAMTDIIFFKNRVIYFSPEVEGSDLNKNMYGKYLKNFDEFLDKIKNRREFLKIVDIEKQEMLLKNLIKIDDLSNDLSQLDDEKIKGSSPNEYNKATREKV